MASFKDNVLDVLQGAIATIEDAYGTMDDRNGLMEHDFARPGDEFGEFTCKWADARLRKLLEQARVIADGLESDSLPAGA